MAQDLDPPGDLPRGKLLYIEDDAINVAFVRGLVEGFPALELHVAGTGAEGVRLVHAQRPDLVLLDMNLPDTNGLQVVRDLNIEIADGLKVVLLTADTFSTDVVKAMSLGAREYWVKPMDGRRLHDGLVRLLRGAA